MKGLIRLMGRIDLGSQAAPWACAVSWTDQSGGNQHKNRPIPCPDCFFKHNCWQLQVKISIDWSWEIFWGNRPLIDRKQRGHCSIMRALTPPPLLLLLPPACSQTLRSPVKHLDYISFICYFSTNINIILYHVTLFCATWHYFAPCDIILYHVTLFCTTWHYLVPRDIILYHVTLFCTTWHYFVPLDIILYHVT